MRKKIKTKGRANFFCHFEQQSTKVFDWSHFSLRFLPLRSTATEERQRRGEELATQRWSSKLEKKKEEWRKWRTKIAAVLPFPAA
jgi:hypothetical protein